MNSEEEREQGVGTMLEKSTIHNLKVSLDGIYPTIWRRLAVPSMATLADLHAILQIALGWEGYHLHEFHVLFDACFGMGDLVQGQAAEEATLGQIAGWEGARLRYVYDLGDCWEHTIVVERIARPVGRPAPNNDRGSGYPRCLGGARAIPPEDCGGPENYMAMLRRRQSRQARQSRQVRQAGQSPKPTRARTGFDPTAFDRHEINRQLGTWRENAAELTAGLDAVNEQDNV